MPRTLLLFALSFCAGAQTPLAFEVASVKMAGQDQPAVMSARKRTAGMPASGNPTLFTRRNATLSSLILAAYGLQPQQLVGPDWLTTQRYEIEARAPEGATPEQQLVMLQSLLAERFQLKSHRETRELPVYELVVAKGGSKLKEGSDPGARPLPAMKPGPFALGMQDGATVVRLREHGTMEALAARLSPQADRLILDRTGLKGSYDVVMYWTPAGPPRAAEPSTAPQASDPGMTLFTALESQLGLKLESKKGMAEVFVVDHAEKVPTEN